MKKIKDRYKLFGSRLRNRRLDLNLTQSEVSLHCGFDSTLISHLENGRCFPCVDNLIRICDFLEITPNDLLGYK